ncbi:MAG TPA: ABC transporter ATP-binding protein [Gammaproteobacteria bacterium]|nr:ABC transporter ATP-binding protein [Gammaproteobacteria bacterium]
MYDDYYDDGLNELELAAHARFGLWRKLFRYAQRYRADLRRLTFFAVCTACMEVAYPLITKAVVDEVAARGAGARFLPYAAAYLGCTLILAASVGAFIWAGGKIRTCVSHDIRQSAFENVQRLSFDFFDHRPVGWLMARMTSDCDRLANILTWAFLDTVWGVTMMLGIAVAMLAMNVKLALIVLAVMPVLAWVSGKFQKRILKSAREVRRTNSRITAAYNEGIMGVLTSKAFVREDENLREFRELTGRMYESSVLNLTQAAVYVPIVLTLASLATGLTLAVGGFDLLGGALSAGTLVAFMAYARTFFDPVEQLGRWFAEMQMAQASAERILSLVEAVPTIKDSEEVLDGPGRIDRIELRDVEFAYDPRHPVLRRVSLRASRGETIAIVGPTGGGKSTLVNLICRFYEPTAGEVLVDGVDYRRRSLGWLQSKIGMVLQNAHVFSGSILENIRYGRLDASDEEVVAAAKLAGAHDFITGLEQGYATEAGEGGNRLSAGQKQLISFARAILADPQILVMDEATSSVDTETERRIQQGLGRVLSGRIAFVIAHRLSTIRNATRIVVVEDGRITESGTHRELMALRGHYFELYRQQSLRERARLGAARAVVDAVDAAAPAPREPLPATRG